MGLFNKLKGHQKEAEAESWLKQQSIQILAKNYTCKGGEIDLIGLDKTQTLIFFEVKSRKNASYGHPTEYITPQKQQRLIKCAEVFLIQHPQYQNHPQRFDSISFLADAIEPEWLQNIMFGF